MDLYFVQVQPWLLTMEEDMARIQVQRSTGVCVARAMDVAPSGPQTPLSTVRPWTLLS